MFCYSDFESSSTWNMKDKMLHRNSRSREYLDRIWTSIVLYEYVLTLTSETEISFKILSVRVPADFKRIQELELKSLRLYVFVVLKKIVILLFNLLFYTSTFDDTWSDSRNVSSLLRKRIGNHDVSRYTDTIKIRSFLKLINNHILNDVSYESISSCSIFLPWSLDINSVKEFAIILRSWNLRRDVKTKILVVQIRIGFNEIVKIKTITFVFEYDRNRQATSRNVKIQQKHRAPEVSGYWKRNYHRIVSTEYRQLSSKKFDVNDDLTLVQLQK